MHHSQPGLKIPPITHLAKHLENARKRKLQLLIRKRIWQLLLRKRKWQLLLRKKKKMATFVRRRKLQFDLKSMKYWMTNQTAMLNNTEDNLMVQIVTTTQTTPQQNKQTKD